MAPPTPPPKIKLSRLRDIGWSIWDPIGLLAAGKRWDDEDCRGFADEYDRYLINAAGDLRGGRPDIEVVDYLIQIEAEYMGLGKGIRIRERAQSVVDAIHADEHLSTYSDM